MAYTFRRLLHWKRVQFLFLFYFQIFGNTDMAKKPTNMAKTPIMWMTITSVTESTYGNIQSPMSFNWTKRG